MADAQVPPALGWRDHPAEARRAVVPPPQIGDDRAADQLDARRKVLMRPGPVPLDVADRDALALRPGKAPDLGGADASGGAVEVPLRRLEEPTARRGSLHHRRDGLWRHEGVPDG